MTLTRRTFLRALGWSAAGLTAIAGSSIAAVGLPVLPHRRDPTDADAEAWVSLRPDGMIEIASPRAELGQGIASGFRRIVASAMDVPVARVRFCDPATDRVRPALATVGSDGIRLFGPPLDRAARRLRAAAIRRAVAMAGGAADGGHLAADGVAFDSGATVGYAALTRAPLLLSPDEELPSASLPSPSGEAVEPDGIRSLVTAAKPFYADDVQLPGMAFGRVVKPPRPGAVAAHFEATAAEALPGVLAVIAMEEGIGIVTERRHLLDVAEERLAVVWTGGIAVDQATVDAAVAITTETGDEHRLVKRGSADKKLRGVDLVLEVAMAAHAAIEPRTAVARIQDNLLEVWTGSQDVAFVRSVLSSEFGEMEVVVRGCRVGGGFGARTIVAVEREAARLAAATGRPVKVRWTRAEEHRNGFHRPPSVHRVSAAADETGRIASVTHRIRSGHVIFTSAAMSPLLQAVTSLVADPGVARGAVPPYDAEALDIAFEDVRLPVPTGPWRGLGAGPNGWAIETIVDALARRCGVDPLDMRLASLGPDRARLRLVLERVAAMAGWRARKQRPGRGFGLACGIYKEAAFAAVVAEVETTMTGVRLVKLWCAHDCGAVVDPDRVRAQIEGNLVWSIGMVLSEGLPIEDGAVVADYAACGLPTLSQVPPIEVELVGHDHPPGGAGETAITAGPTAIATAIAEATGVPITRLPWTRRE